MLNYNRKDSFLHRNKMYDILYLNYQQDFARVSIRVFNPMVLFLAITNHIKPIGNPTPIFIYTKVLQNLFTL